MEGRVGLTPFVRAVPSMIEKGIDVSVFLRAQVFRTGVKAVKLLRIEQRNREPFVGLSRPAIKQMLGYHPRLSFRSKTQDIAI